jgi:hypothetical protein
MVGQTFTMTIITDKITELTTFINGLPAGDPRADDAAKTLAIWQEAAATGGGGGGGSSGAISVVYTETLLSTPGSTDARSLSGGYTKAFVSYTVANINTSVTVRLEGSNDGVTWINLDPSGDKTIAANGTDFYQLIDVTPLNIRFTFVSEVGGTAATIQVITRLSS